MNCSSGQTGDPCTLRHFLRSLDLCPRWDRSQEVLETWREWQTRHSVNLGVGEYLPASQAAKVKEENLSFEEIPKFFLVNPRPRGSTVKLRPKREGLQAGTFSPSRRTAERRQRYASWCTLSEMGEGKWKSSSA